MKPEYRSSNSCDHMRGCSIYPSCDRFQTGCMYAINQCGRELTRWVPRRPWWWRIIRTVIGFGGLIR